MKPSSNYPDLGGPPVFLLGLDQDECLHDSSLKLWSHLQSRSAGDRPGKTALRKGTRRGSGREEASTCEPSGGEVSISKQHPQYETKVLRMLCLKLGLSPPAGDHDGTVISLPGTPNEDLVA